MNFDQYRPITWVFRFLNSLDRILDVIVDAWVERWKPTIIVFINIDMLLISLNTRMHDTPFSGANWTAGTRGIVNRDVFPGLIRRFQRNDGILFIHFSFKQNFIYIYTFFLFMSQCGVVLVPAGWKICKKWYIIIHFESYNWRSRKGARFSNGWKFPFQFVSFVHLQFIHICFVPVWAYVLWQSMHWLYIHINIYI